jgi:DNA-directed RNA polymerase subunit RPC12/RpoP
VPGGGLNGDQWVTGTSKDDFLFPVKVMAALFRGKFMAYFKNAIHSGELLFHGDLRCFEEDKSFLKQLIDHCYSVDWVVYAKPPFGGPAAVVKYLGRYTHRIAVANSRIIALSDTHVTFRWKDYADKNRSKEMILTISEFIRRFLLHVLPKRFVRIRYYGFLGMRIRKKSLQFCRDQLCSSEEFVTHETIGSEELDVETAGKTSNYKCPHCGSGRMYRYREFSRGIPESRTKTAA